MEFSSTPPNNASIGDGIYTALARFGVPEHLIKLVRVFHTWVTVKIAMRPPLMETFPAMT